MPDFNWRFLPPTRRPDQYNVILTQESPMTNFFENSEQKISGFFNLTMTYRTDSDVAMSYGFVMKKKKNWFNFTEAQQIVAKKTKPVAWVVSHCSETNSKREFYADALSRFIQIDVYGKCSKSNLKCPQNIEAMLHPTLIANSFKIIQIFRQTFKII